MNYFLLIGIIVLLMVLAYDVGRTIGESKSIYKELFESMLKKEIEKVDLIKMDNITADVEKLEIKEEDLEKLKKERKELENFMNYDGTPQG